MNDAPHHALIASTLSHDDPAPRSPANAGGVLRAKARAFIRAAKLNQPLPDRRWGGPGVGAPCSLCGATVEQHEMDIEIELTCGTADGSNNHHFHVRCLSALEHELRAPGQHAAAGCAGGQAAVGEPKLTKVNGSDQA